MANRKYVHRINSPAPPVTNWTQVPVLFDIHMAARLLNKTVEGVRRLICAGELPAHKAGGEWRLRKDEIMLALGFTPIEVERYGFSMNTPREAVTIIERIGKEERMYDLA